jgi:hypothetical protein
MNEFNLLFTIYCVVTYNCVVTYTRELQLPRIFGHFTCAASSAQQLSSRASNLYSVLNQLYMYAKSPSNIPTHQKSYAKFRNPRTECIECILKYKFPACTVSAHTPPSARQQKVLMGSRTHQGNRGTRAQTRRTATVAPVILGQGLSNQMCTHSERGSITSQSSNPPIQSTHNVLEGLLNENNSSLYGVHVFPPKKPRGKGVHIQSNRRSKDFEDIAIFVR